MSGYSRTNGLGVVVISSSFVRQYKIHIQYKLRCLFAVQGLSHCSAVFIITFAKEVMIYPAFVCLSVGLFVHGVTKVRVTRGGNCFTSKSDDFFQSPLLLLLLIPSP